MSNSPTFLARIMGFVSGNSLLLIVSTCSYFILSSFLSVSISDEVMFDNFSPNADSNSYLEVGRWVFGGDLSEHVATRPFLFPLIITSIYSVGGVYMLWLYQFLAYILGSLFLHKSIEKITKSKTNAWLGSFLYLINFSLIGLSYHALTEVTVVFGLTIGLFLSVLLINKQLAVSKYWSLIILLLSALTLVKPVFSYPFYFCIFLIVAFLVFKKIIFKTLLLWPIVIGISLIITQLFVVKSTFGEYSISTISGKTYKNYLLSQVISEKEALDRTASVLKANQMNNEEIVTYSSDNSGLLFSSFFGNLQENIQAHSYVEDYNTPAVNAAPARFMLIYNKATLLVHLFILVFGAMFFVIQIRKKSFDLVIVLGLFWTLLLYYIFVTGISFDQRDRLVMAALPLWIFFFMVFSNYILTYLKSPKVTR